MIVCWVLFGILASLAIFGIAVSHYYENQILNISDHVIKPEHDEPYEIVRALEYGLDAAEELIRRHELREQPASPLPEGFVLDPPTISMENEKIPIDEVRAKRTELSEKYRIARKHESKIEGGNVVAYLSFFAALVMLLWNIIWHTGHWVWVGRKVQ